MELLVIYLYFRLLIHYYLYVLSFHIHLYGILVYYIYINSETSMFQAIGSILPLWNGHMGKIALFYHFGEYFAYMEWH